MTELSKTNKGFLTDNRRFILAVVLLHLVYFLLALHFKRIYNGDSFEYIYEALNIKQLFLFYSGNASLPIVPEYLTQRMPLYPLFMWMIYSITINNWVILLLQNALSVINILMCRKMLRSSGMPDKADWLLFLMIAAYPSQFINANTIAPDILLQTFTLIYAAFIFSLFKTSRRKYELLSGVALIAGIMVKPVLYPFIFVHILILAGNSIWGRLKPQRTIAIALVPAVVMFFFAYWNQTRTGKFHVTSNQAFNSLYYFQPYIRSHYGADSAAKFIAAERKEASYFTAYKDRYDFSSARGVALWRQHWLSYSLFHLAGSAKMLFDPGKAEMDLFTGKLSYGRLYGKTGKPGGFASVWADKGWGGVADYVKDNLSVFPALLVFVFNMLKVIGFLFFLRYFKNTPFALRTFAVVSVAYFVLIAGPIESPRYFLPVSLLYSGFAAWGLFLYYRSKFKSGDFATD